MEGQALRRYAHKLHASLGQPPDDWYRITFQLSEALEIANFVSARSWSTAASTRSQAIRSGQARRAKSAPRDKRISFPAERGLLDKADGGNRRGIKLGSRKG